ncbi:uncharacterized protein [Periplaneta americana]|uniref:uncharacterized protein isoform X3 n=1 Tax=Periplaneta americana TaxID=6978 RepID=UPI0037E94CB0
MVKAYEPSTNEYRIQDNTDFEKLRLSVFYEPLCPSSLKFFKEQLKPTYEALAEYIDLELVPFGKANQSYVNETFHFECTHGEVECYAEIVHACAFEEFSHIEDYVPFIFCLMSEVNTTTNLTNELYPVENCGNSLDLELKSLNKCIGTKGPQLLSTLGNRTESLTPSLRDVPSIVVNKIYDVNDQINALQHLKNLVCERMKYNNKSAANCTEEDNAHNGHEHHDHDTSGTDHNQMQSSSDIKLSIYYESLCPDSIAFFKDQLLPVNKELGNYLNIDLIPFGKSSQWYSDNQFQFTCHHGPKECYGNIVHACAVKHFSVPDDRIAYVGCLMTTVDTKLTSNDSFPLEPCGKTGKFPLDVEKIKRCVNAEGLSLLSEMGNKTAKLSPPLSSVPAVAVNMTYKLEDQSKLTKELKSVVCAQLKTNYPKLEACNTSSMATATSGIILITFASVLLANIIS